MSFERHIETMEKDIAASLKEVKYATTEEPGQVPMHQEELEKAVTILQEKLMVLKERLKTVMRKEDEVGPDVSKQESDLVPVALFLFVTTERIRNTISKVDSLLRRIEL